MKQHEKRHVYRRLKVGGLALGAFVLGLGLLVLNRYILASNPAPPTTASATTAPPTTTAPATTAPAENQPAGPAETPGDTDPDTSRQAAAANMAGLLLMIGLMCMAVSAVCVGWIVYDVRSSRPAWRTQTRYPRRR